MADAQRAEHQDRHRHAGASQDDPFLDVGAREHGGACLLQRTRHAPVAMPVGVGLDHRDDGRRSRRSAGRGRERRASAIARRWARLAHECADRAKVGLQRGEIHARDCAADHAPCARLANRVCSRRKASRTTAGRAVTLLGDDQLRRARIRMVGIPVVGIFPVDQQDNIRILLERARLAQVRELGPVVGTRLWRAAQLRQHDDRHIELLSEPFQRA